MSNDVTALELMALKAAVLPMLIKESKQVMSQVSRTELSGMLKRGFTCSSKGQEKQSTRGRKIREDLHARSLMKMAMLCLGQMTTFAAKQSRQWICRTK